jgi:hypothetical protein
MSTRFFNIRLIAVAALLLAGMRGGPLRAADRAAAVPNDTDSVRHALNRLTYGPRPGDVERVEKTGLATWIDRQLRPSTIDDSALEAQLPEPPPPVQAGTGKEARREARQAVETLATTRLIRAAASERQLDEVLVDFWFNHFNVFAGRVAPRSICLNTSETSSVLTCSAISAICSRPRQESSDAVLSG